MKNETNFNVENLDVLTDQELLIIKGGSEEATGEIHLPEGRE